jgi:hypothetical protein
MRIKASVLVTAAALVALLASTYARTLPPTTSVDNHLGALAGRAPIEPIIPVPKPEPEPKPGPEAAPGAPKASGGAPKVSDGPAHLSIPESGLPKPTATHAESVAPTTGPAKSNAPAATQAKSVAPSVTEDPRPADPAPKPAPKPGDTEPAPAPPASKPKDIEPDEVALCKRTGCDLTPDRLTKIRQNSEDQQTLLDNAIKNNKPDTESKQNIVPLYTRDINDRDAPVVQAQPWFSPFGILNKPENWKSSVVRNSPQQLQRIEEQSRPLILKTYQNPNQGAILIAKSANKEEDALVTDPIASTPATRWSDMVMDNWRVIAGNDKQNLRWILRDNIQDADDELNIPSAQGLIDQALKLMGKDPSENIQLEIPRPTATSSQAEKDAYNTLLGTVHVDRVVKMLKDHHQELGGLNIQSIFVVKNGEYNLAIQLTKVS